MLISPYPDQEGNKLQRPNSNFCKPLKKKKKIRKLSVQPGVRDSNDLRVGLKMTTFQLFFQSGRANDLSAPLYQFKRHLNESNLIFDVCKVERFLYSVAAGFDPVWSGRFVSDVSASLLDCTVS